MSAKIISTTIGPIVVSGDKYITVNDTQDLMDEFIKDPTLPDKIKEHIVAEIEKSFAEYLEGVKMNFMPTPQKIYSVTSMFMTFSQFVQHQWLGYLRAVQEAEATNEGTAHQHG